ncbi:MAG: hypothetical protein COV75_07465 [Candidatus Omnitrophica bacterium CG11_big_fil_rev_8_21_14_0_20_63_9]|nr:MAG: hypothetical protein COV75_07465 [Candidatus Omnitrophica bacterium CG11_big_fil_rev_8_21_14_0_20_63_9]
MARVIDVLGLLAAVAMPLWNIPLILRLERRRSSKDISLTWALGVFGCILLMLPSGLLSPDPVFRVFSAVNSVLFAGVVVQVWRFR